MEGYLKKCNSPKALLIGGSHERHTLKGPDGEPEYDGEEDNEEYEESMEELRFLFDSYNW